MVTMDGRRAPVVMDNNGRSTSMDHVRLPDTKASHIGSSSASDRTPVIRSMSSSKNGALLRGWLYEDTNVVPGLVIRRCAKLRVMYSNASALHPNQVWSLTTSRCGHIHKRKRQDSSQHAQPYWNRNQPTRRPCVHHQKKTHPNHHRPHLQQLQDPETGALHIFSYDSNKLHMHMRISAHVHGPSSAQYHNCHHAHHHTTQTGFRVVWTPLGGTQQESALYFDETHTAEAWRELMLLSTDAQPLRAVAPSPPTLPDACATVFQDAPGPSVADSSPHSMSAASADECVYCFMLYTPF